MFHNILYLLYSKISKYHTMKQNLRITTCNKNDLYTIDDKKFHSDKKKKNGKDKA